MEQPEGVGNSGVRLRGFVAMLKVIPIRRVLP
jgi:hypothetical protein